MNHMISISRVRCISLFLLLLLSFLNVSTVSAKEVAVSAQNTDGYHIIGDVLLNGAPREGTTVKISNGTIEYTGVYGEEEKNTSLGKYQVRDSAAEPGNVHYYFDVPEGVYTITVTNGNKAATAQVTTTPGETYDLGYGVFYIQMVNNLTLSEAPVEEEELWSSQPVVPSNKDWIIEFSIPVNKGTIKAQHIYVLDSNNNDIPITVEPGTEEKTVVVKAPQGGYTPGEQYTLYIKKNVQSHKGKEMKKGVKMIFTIEEAGTFPFMLASPAFKNNEPIGSKYANTGISGGLNTSVPLAWTGAPAGTKSFALIMYDTHPIADNWVHWAVTDIPPAATGIEEGASGTSTMPAGSVELKNTFGSTGYGGPQPPPGLGSHQYKFVLYALNVEKVNVNKQVSFEQFYNAVKDNIIESKELVGTFSN